MPETGMQFIYNLSYERPVFWIQNQEDYSNTKGSVLMLDSDEIDNILLFPQFYDIRTR